MKVFISYSRIDASETANTINTYLKDSGHKVFIDTLNIREGDEWWKTIKENISDCDIFVLIVSRSAFRRPEVKKELELADSMKKRIIPCVNKRYVNYEDLPDNIRKYNGINFERLEDLIQELDYKIELEIKDQGKTSKEVKTEENTAEQKNEKHNNDWSYQGDVYFKQKNYLQAIDYYDKALEIDPKNESIRYNRFLANQYLSKEKQDYIESLHNKGNALYDQGKYQEAKDCYYKILKIDPTFASTLVKKGSDLVTQGKYQEAIEWYDMALSTDPNYISVLNLKGLALYNQGKYQEAIECYDKALIVDPNFFMAKYNKGLALQRLSKEKSSSSYDTMPKGLMPADWKPLSYSNKPVPSEETDALNDKGLDLYNQGKYQEAIEYFYKALSIDPNYKYAFYNIGVVFSELGKYQEAIEWYDKALRIDPNFSHALGDKRIALLSLGKY